MPDIDSLDDEIVELLRSASFEDATGKISAHWQAYLPERAAVLGERIRMLPEGRWEAEPALLLALASSYRCAPSSNPFAALAYFDAAEAANAAGIPSPGVEALVRLGRARSLRGLGRFLDARRELATARAAVTAASLGVLARLELEAIALFEEGICLALVGELDAAARRLRHGLGLSGARDALPGTLEALGWLAFVEYFAGSPTAPLPYLARASELVAASTPVEAAPALLVEAAIALDNQDDATARELLERLRGVVAGTEYAVFALYLESLITAVDAGPLAQLETLQEIQLAIHDWQAPALIRSLRDVERADALIRLGSVGAARDAAEELRRRSPVHARHAHCPARPAALVCLHVGDYEAVLEVTAGCRAMGDRHAPRSLAHIDLLRSAAHDALGDAGVAAENVDRALLQAARTGWRRQFTTLPPARLAAMLDSAALRPQPPAALAVLQHLREGFSAPLVAAVMPLSARERLILGRIVAGQTRRQISAQLNVSPNTIKAQVRSIYHKLGASNRHEAIDRATKQGFVG